MKLYTKKFWQDAFERAAKTAAQSAIGVFVAGQTIMTVDWAQSGAIIGTATLVSVLTSIVSEKVGTPQTASLIKE